MNEENREFAPRGPVEIAQFLDVRAQELHDLNVRLQRATEVLEKCEERWIEHYDEIMDQLEEERDGKSLPGEEKCISIARRRGGAQAWTNLRRAERAVKRIEKQATITANVISACQSEAKLLRAA